MAHFDELCGYCAYMNTDLSSVHDGRFLCERDGEWRFADTRACSRFCEIFWYKSDKSLEAIKESKSYKKSMGCYITTAVVSILGLPNDCRELTVLKDFRARVMQGNLKYSLLLMKYDIYGPMIADYLLRKWDIDLAMDLFNTYIKKTADYIEEGNRLADSGIDDNDYYDAALELYIDMTKMLIETCIPGYGTLQGEEKSSEHEISNRRSFKIEKKEA